MAEEEKSRPTYLRLKRKRNLSGLEAVGVELIPDVKRGKGVASFEEAAKTRLSFVRVGTVDKSGVKDSNSRYVDVVPLGKTGPTSDSENKSEEAEEDVVYDLYVQSTAQADIAAELVRLEDPTMETLLMPEYASEASVRGTDSEETVDYPSTPEDDIDYEDEDKSIDIDDFEDASLRERLRVRLGLDDPYEEDEDNDDKLLPEREYMYGWHNDEEEYETNAYDAERDYDEGEA
mmetsp:Transcript_3343/g.10188  ORF Transcript_3343/g.10188 Transcript_3343/m.10188 type:complete len:233 (+) Transcript_3343:44-742(+)